MDIKQVCAAMFMASMYAGVVVLLLRGVMSSLSPAFGG